MHLNVKIRLGVLALLMICLLMPMARAAEEPLVHYILLGFDFWGDETIGTSFSDANLIVTLDKSNGRILLTSIMRDSYMPLPGGGYSKLNGIARKYDIPTHVETVEQALGITIGGYVAVNAPGFARIVGAMGGLEITLTQSEYNSLVSRNKANGIPGPGTHLLKGNAVYNYLMDRYMGGGDGARTQKARDVAELIFEQVSTMAWGDVLQLISTALEEVQTNIPVSVLMSEALALFQMEQMEIEQFRLPVDDAYWYENVNGSSTVQWNWTTNLQAFQAFMESAD